MEVGGCCEYLGSLSGGAGALVACGGYAMGFMSDGSMCGLHACHKRSQK